MLPLLATARLLTGGLVLVGALALAGCGVPPELREPADATAPSSTAPATRPNTPTTAPQSPTPTPISAPTFGDQIAGNCQGRPTDTQVIALLRRADLIPAGVAVTVAKPPVCAGSWQYTVVRVAGHEPLQVVSKGQPTSLTLVTAGTDVCTIEVRTAAPPGIRTVACF